MASDDEAVSVDGDLDGRIKETLKKQIGKTRWLIKKYQQSMENMKRLMHMMLGRSTFFEN